MKLPKYSNTVFVITILIAWSVFFYFFDAHTFIETLGVKNGYAVMFFVALFGGVSSFGGVTYITTLLTLSSGGLQPLYLALASGLGVSVGDTVYFYLGKQGLRKYYSSFEERHPKIKILFRKVSLWFEHASNVKTFLGVYFITAFTPMPNDIIALLCGLTNRSYVASVSALVFGNITHTFLLASFGKVFFFL